MLIQYAHLLRKLRMVLGSVAATVYSARLFGIVKSYWFFYAIVLGAVYSLGEWS